MTEAPERIWRVKPWLPSQYQHGLASWPVEAHAGPEPTEYIRADHHDALLKAEREKALREAAEACERVRLLKANGPMPEGASFDYEQSILALIEKDKTDG